MTIERIVIKIVRIVMTIVRIVIKIERIVIRIRCIITIVCDTTTCLPGNAGSQGWLQVFIIK